MFEARRTFRMLTLIGLAGLAVCRSGPLLAGEKKEPEKRGGTVVGVVTAVDAKSIEVKADGEEKGRRYVPRWVGGVPAQGGGPEKAMLEQFGKVKVGSRVKLDWEFEERPRAIKL